MNLETQINEIWPQKTQTHRIIRDHHKPLEEALEEKGRLLDSYNLLKLNHETINLNWSIAKMEMDSVVKSLPTKKSPPPLQNFTKLFKRTYPNFPQAIQSNRNGGNFSKLFMMLTSHLCLVLGLMRTISR